MKSLVDILNEVKLVAKDAGSFIREQRNVFDPNMVETKGAHDYVSYVDKGAEKLIVERLKQIVPEGRFVTEEGTMDDERVTMNDERLMIRDSRFTIHDSRVMGHGSRLEDNHESLIINHEPQLCWVVDPLDGTTNFVHDMAPYCVAIALRSEEEILVGVVYEVVADELFYTCKGQPSYLNGREIHVGSAKVVNDAFINIGYPYDVNFWKPKMQRLVGELYGNCASIRNLGSAETELCYVACGRFDAYIESHLKPWDVTAGGLILMNAGGRVTDYAGGEKWLTGEELLATNGFIHDELVKTITIR